MKFSRVFDLSKSLLLCATCFWVSSVSGNSQEENIAESLSRIDNFSSSQIDASSDSYFEGYIQALIDMHYHEYQVVVRVKDGTVWLSNLPKNEQTANSIISFVKDVPGVEQVKTVEEESEEEKQKHKEYMRRPQVSGTWFPQMTVLFQPLVASPREITNSIGYRIGDEVVGNRVVPVSLGDIFTVYRWHHVVYGGDLELGLTSGIWSVFNIDGGTPNIAEGTELVNTDFFFGIVMNYANDRWSSRFRLYHISSHLGDEFLVNNPGYDRVNPSLEAIDIFVSYQATFGLRVYVGPGVIFHWDESYKLKPMYIQYGLEYRFLGTRFLQQKLYGTVFAGAHGQNYQYQDWGYDGTYVLGYEWSKLQGIGRKMRVYVQYHHGYSQEGQFSREKSSYISYLLSYGF